MKRWVPCSNRTKPTKAFKTSHVGYQPRRVGLALGLLPGQQGSETRASVGSPVCTLPVASSTLSFLPGNLPAAQVGKVGRRTAALGLIAPEGIPPRIPGQPDSRRGWSCCVGMSTGIDRRCEQVESLGASWLSKRSAVHFSVHLQSTYRGHSTI